MANIMSLKDVRNKVHRNGFDLSFRNTFTAKIGELLPVMCKEVIPGDKFNIDLASMVRTQPVKTAAFTRLKEYYDFYFVPTSLLWDKFDNFIIQTNNYNHAKGFTLSPDNLTNHPYFTGSQLFYLLKLLYAKRGDDDGTDKTRIYNIHGFSGFDTTCKLLEYLGYGNWANIVQNYSKTSLPSLLNVSYNPFPLLAYQKICQDHFRYDQWQSSRPYLFNLDYIFSSNQLVLPIASYEELNLKQRMFLNDTIFSLQYATYRKDLFTGLLPKAQYGDTAIAAPLVGEQYFMHSHSPSSGTAGSDYLHLEAKANYPYPPESLASGLGVSVFALRFAEATQKYREITQSGDLDFKTQLEKHWNVKVSDYQSYRSRWIGGISNNIDINEVTNQNLTGDNQAVLAGKGLGTQQRKGVVHFESKSEYGYFICLYHAEPVLDWTSAGVDRHNLKISATDYAIPEFDNIGMESVSPLLVTNGVMQTDEGTGNTHTFSFIDPSDSLGYAPRYYDYKQSLDIVRGGFLTVFTDWVSPLRLPYFLHTSGAPATDVVHGSLDYRSFLISPSSVNPIFLSQATGTVDSDILMNSVFFDFKAVRNLSVSGLPY